MCHEDQGQRRLKPDERSEAPERVGASSNAARLLDWLTGWIRRRGTPDAHDFDGRGSGAARWFRVRSWLQSSRLHAQVCCSRWLCPRRRRNGGVGCEMGSKGALTPGDFGQRSPSATRGVPEALFSMASWARRGADRSTCAFVVALPDRNVHRQHTLTSNPVRPCSRRVGTLGRAPWAGRSRSGRGMAFGRRIGPPGCFLGWAVRGGELCARCERDSAADRGFFWNEIRPAPQAPREHRSRRPLAWVNHGACSGSHNAVSTSGRCLRRRPQHDASVRISPRRASLPRHCARARPLE